MIRKRVKPLHPAEKLLPETKQYGESVGASKRVRRDIDKDVLRGREFDTSHRFLPDDSVPELEAGAGPSQGREGSSELDDAVTFVAGDGGSREAQPRTAAAEIIRWPLMDNAIDSPCLSEKSHCVLTPGWPRLTISQMGSVTSNPDRPFAVLFGFIGREIRPTIRIQLTG